MKIFKKVFFLLLFAFFILPLVARAEEVSSLKFYAWINEDSSIKIVEDITYNFGSEKRHGIYRNIPYIYETDKGDYATSINIVSVVDTNAQAVNYTVNKKGGYQQVKIGDANQYVTGSQTYRLTYKVDNALNYFEDHDEFYWNTVGNEWDVNIQSAEAYIFLPDQFENSQIETACYTGKVKSKETNCHIELSKQDGKSVVRLKSSQLLGPGAGMTVAVGWPKGHVTAQEKAYGEVREKGSGADFNLLNLLWLLLLLIPVGAWYKFGRDEKMDTIIPEYEPPVGIAPVEAGVVIDDKLDVRDTTATIIDLARRGYLKVRSEEKKVLGFNKKEWSLVKIKEIDNGLQGFERAIFNVFFKQKSVYHFKQIAVVDDNYESNMEAFHNLVYRKLVRDEYYVSNPKNIKKIFWGIGLVILFFTYVVTESLGFGIWSIIMGILGINFLVVSVFMAKKTAKGLETKRKLLGFKMFLSTTEKDRVKFHFSPEKNPEKFADYLPWAIIFGVEKEWARVFKDVTLPQPTWYQGAWDAHITASIFSGMVNDFSGRVKKNINTKSSAAAGGASGLGGGGFSGGGFSGGGGGSW